jgi:septal ring factor EnvC (AmiA/AmiB activator)
METIIKRWNKIDQYLKEKKKQMKKYVDKKKELEKQITDSKKEVSYTIGNDIVSIQKKETKESLNIKTIQSYLDTYIKTKKYSIPPGFTTDFINFLENRDTKISYKINKKQMKSN